jgi:hypothetical protein
MKLFCFVPYGDQVARRVAPFTLSALLYKAKHTSARLRQNNEQIVIQTSVVKMQLPSQISENRLLSSDILQSKLVQQ